MTDESLADRHLTAWEAWAITPRSPYVRGPTYAERATPRFEFKPGAVGYTGGGYARIRSCERRDHTPGDNADDVFVSVHRLMAVVHCYPDDEPLANIQRDMVGTDVHHTLGMPSANLPECLETRDHGEHAEITQAQRRAWARDEQRERERARAGADEVSVCPRCTSPMATEATHAGVDTAVCLTCATETANGRTIELV